MFQLSILGLFVSGVFGQLIGEVPDYVFKIVEISARGGCYMLLAQVIQNIIKKYGIGVIALLFPLRLAIYYSCRALDRADVTKEDTLGYLCIAQKI